MTVTTTTTASTPRRRGTTIAPTNLVGGIGGLLFVATVIAQNAIRASAPADGASAAKVMHFYATDRGSTMVLAALFPLGAAGLAAFIGALGSRCSAPGARAPVMAGMLGAAGIFATYTMLIATDLALAGYVHRGAADPSVVNALWVTHNTVFGVLLIGIAVALAGLSASAAVVGLLPPLWKQVGALGALALAVTGAATPVLLDGNPIIALGLAGFLVWLAFIAMSSVTFIRRPV